ncbi:hypothetical protein [Methylovirgula sp. 4M-Z18]|uniref:hypothetical protein n=1 Tax=Methylovirgula sp. 4M-Z18 TaxID=2293567 RepID=UPI000E2F983F|nr:hypothetical protein [Methylovirgula sp. 4M-Z18]RFB81169.1 hypothetical protein DYH55_06905 [Methylovirgula sp. 4M-Z18]
MKYFRLLILVLAAAVGGYVGWHYTVAPQTPLWPSLSPTDASQHSTEPASAGPGLEVYDTFYQKLDAAFPGERERINAAFHPATPLPEGATDTDAAMLNLIQNLRAERSILEAKAQTDKMLAIFAVQGTILGELGKADPRLCGDFLYGTTSPAFLAFAAHHRDLITKMAQANLDAMVDGKASNVERSRPTEQDISVLENSLTARGLSKAEIDHLVDNTMPAEPIPDDRLCAIGKIHMDVLQQLSEPARSNILSAMINLMSGG